MISSILALLLSTLAFALCHSLMASQRCKQLAYHIDLKEPHYRLLYTIFSLITTVIWLAYIHQLPDNPLYHVEGVAAWFMYALQGLGVLLALAAFIPIDGLVFLGLKASPNSHEPFVVSGVYRYLRHPMYSGAMLILLFHPQQSVNGLIFAFAVCAYFIIGSRFEEKRMLASNPDYAQYQQNVPAFIPTSLKQGGYHHGSQ